MHRQLQSRHPSLTKS